MARKDKSLKLRVFNAVCSTILISAIGYAIIVSWDVFAMGFITASIIGASVPVVLSGEGALEIVLGIFEVLIEGIVELFAGILSAISGIFG